MHSNTIMLYRIEIAVIMGKNVIFKELFKGTPYDRVLSMHYHHSQPSSSANSSLKAYKDSDNPNSSTRAL